MARTTRGTALRRLAVTVESILESLDTSGSECKVCGTMRRTSWTDYRTAQTLGTLANRLRDHADAHDRSSNRADEITIR